MTALNEIGPVNWVSCAPASWKRRRLKFLVNFVGGATPSKEQPEYWNGDIPWVSPKDMKSAEISDAQDHITRAGLSASATSMIPEGSVLVVVRSGILRHTLPVSINTNRVALNQDMKALLPKAGLTSKFLRYFLLGGRRALLDDLRKQGATVESIDQTLFENLRVPLPTVGEQIEISSFLDYETSEADGLVSHYRELIDLLDEKRTALINTAVTRGLDENCARKDADNEHLGSVPAHWQIVKSKVLFHLFNGYAFDGALFSEEATDSPLLVTPGNFSQNGGLYFSEGNSYHYTGPFKAAYELAAGDQVIVMTDLSYKKLILGRCETVNKTGLLLNQRVAKIAMNRNRWADSIDPEFLSYTLNAPALRGQLLSGARGSTVFHTSPQKIGDCVFPLPPPEEQSKIVQYLNGELFRINAVLSKASQTIELAQEHRATLITAAVTGQVDVKSYNKRQKPLRITA